MRHRAAWCKAGWGPYRYKLKLRAVNLACLGWILGFVAILPAGSALAVPVVIVALGDSLTAGTGLDGPEAAFPARLEAALAAVGVDAVVHNAGVAGDTSAAGLARLDWSLVDGTDLVIVELGANDALRGLDPAVTHTNLDIIVGTLRERGIGVLLAGMLAPPNLGKEYGDEFRAAFEATTAAHDVTFYPFFLDGVVAELNYLQRDGMHPNAAGVEVIVERILPTVQQAILALHAK